MMILTGIRSQHMRLFTALMLLALLVFVGGCRASGGLLPEPQGPGGATTTSGVTEVSVALPSKATFKTELAARLDGYRLLIDPLQDGCLTSKLIDLTSSWSIGSINEKLVQGCDYSVAMQLGNLSPDGKTLAKVFFSNWSGTKNGLLVKKESFAGKDVIALQVDLKLTMDGEAAGFGKTGDISVTPIPPGMSNLVIAVEFNKVPTVVTTPVQPGEEVGGGVEFIDIPASKTSNNPNYGPVLNDIVSHEAPGDSNSYDDLVTLGHETCHGIHAYIRNKFNKLGRKANGFYVLNGKGVLVAEPRIRKSQIGQFVPKSLQLSRYNLYVAGQTEWDDTPLYIWDEWNAYVNGSATGVDLFKSGKWKAGSRDAVFGTLEFVSYSIAVAMAVQKYDEEYFRTNKQFRHFLAWNLKRGMDLYLEGSKVPDFQFNGQQQLYENLKTNKDAEELRNFSREYFGKEWTQRVLGF